MAATRLARILRSGLPDTNPIPNVLWRLMDHSVPRKRRPTKRLSRLLAESLDDGTPQGAETAAQYERLCAVVGRIIATEHNALASHLQEDYRRLDPSRGLVGEEDASDDQERAAALCATLHDVMRGAGFQLATAADEERAGRVHFGDENMWHVPLSMDWSRLDGSLVAAHPSSSRSEPQPDGSGRPSWAHAVLMYRTERNGGIAEKRGYFVGPKLEELFYRLVTTSAAGRAVRRWRRAVANALARSYSGVLRLPFVASAIGGPAASGDAAVSDRNDSGGTVADGGRAERAADVAEPGAALGSELSDSGSALSRHPLLWRDLLEETALREPTFSHVVLLYRETAAQRAESCRPPIPGHVHVGVYGEVPQCDLELLLPHQRVCMPPMQVASFGSMGLVGGFACTPLLFNEPMSLTGLVTLYAVGAIAVKTALRWRFSKQYYHQLLLTYQSANRVGSCDGAVVYLTRLSEQQQTAQAYLCLHALLRAQGVGGATEAAEASQLASSESQQLRMAVELLHRLDLVEAVSDVTTLGRRDRSAGPLLDFNGIPQDAAAEGGNAAPNGGRGAFARRWAGAEEPCRRLPTPLQHVRLRSLDDAVDAAREYWRRMGESESDALWHARCLARSSPVE